MHLKSLPQYLDIELTDMVAAHVSLRFGMFSITFSERNKKPIKKNTRQRNSFIKIKVLCCKGHKIIFQNYEIYHIFRKSKFRGPRFNMLCLRRLRTLLSYYYYQKEEGAKPGKLVTKLCSIYSPNIQPTIICISLLPRISPAS